MRSKKKIEHKHKLIINKSVTYCHVFNDKAFSHVRVRIPAVDDRCDAGATRSTGCFIPCSSFLIKPYTDSGHGIVAIVPYREEITVRTFSGVMQSKAATV